jgi:hypothetical protein
MPRDVVAVRALAGWRLAVGFDDGTEGVVNVAELVRFTGVFGPLEDPRFFAAVGVHPELGVVCWPNGADLDSDVLHAHVVGALTGPADSSA